MGVYIKNMSLMAFKKIMELGFKVNDDLLIEVAEPHGRLIDESKIPDRTLRVLLETAKAPTVIEAEGE